MRTLSDKIVDAVQDGNMTFAEIAEKFNITARDVELIFNEYLDQMEEYYNERDPMDDFNYVGSPHHY